MARRAKKKPPEDNELRWLTTYGDVVTLLLAFFVMLYAISQVDQQKFQLFVTGLADPFGNPAVAEGLLSDGTGLVGAAFSDAQVGEDGLEGIAILDGLPSMQEAEDGYEEGSDIPDDAVDAAGSNDGSGVLDTPEELIEVQNAIESALAVAGLENAADFEIDMRGLTVAIATDDVLFSSGSATFGERGRDLIAAIAPILSEFSNDVLVEGHTDTVPLLSAGYDNWNLSTDRALAVLKLLVADHGIAPERLAATGYGEFRPKADNETSDGKARNRRVELVIIAQGGDGDGS
jgi:chemotaxis protein MotB